MSLNRIVEKTKKEIKEATKVKPNKDTPAPVVAELPAVVVEDTLPWGGPIAANSIKERDENGVALNKYKDFDVAKTPDYPKVKARGGYLVPVGVYKNVSDLKRLIEKACGNSSVLQQIYREFLISMFGYNGSSSRIEIEKLLSDKTFFHFKHGDVDLFLTKESSIDDFLVSKGSGVFIFDNSQIGSFFGEGLSICFGGNGFKTAELTIRNSLLIASDPEIACDIKGSITRLAEREWASRSVTSGNITLRHSIFVGTLRNTENICLENSAVIKTFIGQSKNVHITRSRLTDTRLNATNNYILNSVLLNCDLNVKSTHITDSKISNKSLNSSELDMAVSHPIGFTDVASPLLPDLKLVSTTLNRLAVIPRMYTAKPLFFEFTDSHSKIAERLKDWTIKSGVDTAVLNQYERRELAMMVYSRMDLLQKLNNISDSKQEWGGRHNLSAHIPFKNLTMLDDNQYHEDIGEF